MKTRIMYIECKGGELTGPGRIGRVTFSKTGKTIRYMGIELQSLKGQGYKSNYYDVETGCEYWVSGPKKNGQDTLYPDRVEIDEDVVEEYWYSIRGVSEKINKTVIRSEGKHAGWSSLEYKSRKA